MKKNYLSDGDGFDGDFAATVRSLFDRIQEWLGENSEEITKIIRSVHRYVIFSDSGWFLHYTTPIDLISDDATSSNITPIMAAYYRDNWPEVAAAFRTQLALMDVDEEAKATFEEALEAHGAGLYRCAVRVLFPEIERLARNELLNGSLGRITSLLEVRRAAGALGTSELHLFGDQSVFGQFVVMSEHLYAEVRSPDRLEELSNSPIPNRHAALHGLISYNSLQSSLAGLIMAEFMFKAISIIKAQPDLLKRSTREDQGPR